MFHAAIQQWGNTCGRRKSHKTRNKVIFLVGFNMYVLGGLLSA